MATAARDRISTLCDEIEEAGFAVVPDVVANDEVDAILAQFDQLSTGQSRRRGEVYAARNLLATVPAVAGLAGAAEIRGLVEPILGSATVAVRAILFDKVPGANWHVRWHQDKVIPVARRMETAGFAAWSVKEGVPHVRPPVAILEQMLSLRIHLDDCGRDNGALQVIPGSHRHGLLAVEKVRGLVAGGNAKICEGRRGSVLVMRPLLLHSSSPAMTPSHRRVVHIEFAADALPGGLEWPRWN